MTQILARIYILHIYETLKKLKNKTSKPIKKKGMKHIIMLYYIYTYMENTIFMKVHM